MTATDLFAAVLGLLVAVGLVIAAMGILGIDLFQRGARPATRRRLPIRLIPPKNERTVLGWLMCPLTAIVLGFAVGVGTGWPVAGVATFAAVIGLPPVFLASGGNRRRVQKMEGIEEWTRSLAGALAASRGLDTALNDATSAPLAIRPAAEALAARIRYGNTTKDALAAFADDLDDPAGDLVAAALMTTADIRGEGISAILSDLADTVSSEIQAELRIEAERAGPRTNARGVVAIAIVSVVFLAAFTEYLKPYSTFLGQTVLAGIVLIAAVCLRSMYRIITPSRPPRFLVSSGGDRG